MVYAYFKKAVVEFFELSEKTKWIIISIIYIISSALIMPFGEIGSKILLDILSFNFIYISSFLTTALFCMPYMVKNKGKLMYLFFLTLLPNNLMRILFLIGAVGEKRYHHVVLLIVPLIIGAVFSKYVIDIRKWYIKKFGF